MEEKGRSKRVIKGENMKEEREQRIKEKGKSENPEALKMMIRCKG